MMKSISLRSRGFSDTQSGRKEGVIYRLRAILPVPVIMVTVLWAEPTTRSLLWGGMVLIGGEMLRLWSAGYLGGRHITQPGEGGLITQGPYALVRNPRYWGNCLIGLGVAVMSGWWVSYLFLLALGIFVHLVILPMEEAVLQERFGEEYEQYARTVPRYVPDSRTVWQWLATVLGKLPEGNPPRDCCFRWQDAWVTERYMLMFLLVITSSLVVKWSF